MLLKGLKQSPLLGPVFLGGAECGPDQFCSECVAPAEQGPSYKPAVTCLTEMNNNLEIFLQFLSILLTNENIRPLFYTFFKISFFNLKGRVTERRESKGEGKRT